MKKILLTLTAVAALATASQAQLANETFNSPGLPANWVTVKVDNNIPWTGFVQRIKDTMAVSAWMKWPKATGDSVMLTISSFSPAGTADRWLITPAFTVNDPNMIIKWQDYAVDPNVADVNEVWVSPTAGTTPADFTTMISNQSGGIGGFVQRGAFIGDYNTQTIRIAFRDHSTNKYVLELDNVGTTVPTNPIDGKIDSIPFTTFTGATSPVSVIVSNQGAQPITSLEVQYVLDAGTPVVQTFSSLNIGPYSSQTLNFTTGLTGLSYGTHNLVVTLNKTNGSADPYAPNNTKTKTFAAVNPANSVARNGLIEEFSSSTCSPCAGFNQTFDPLVVSNNANNGTSRFNIVKYQMNWPSPDNDPAYNTHGLTRRIYYDVSGIPDHFTNGAQGGAGNQAEIDASKTAPSYMTISGTYLVDGNNLVATATITPKFTITGANFSVHMVAAERHYTNNDNTTATVGQHEFYYVERTMFPNGSGTAAPSWTDGTPQTFGPFTKPFVNGTPAQGNDHFWTTAITSDLVIFVQDNSDHSILQSASVPAAWPTGVKELNGINDMAIFPNPAREQAMLGFNTTQAADISIAIVDAIGRTVYTYSQHFQAGSQRIVIPTGDIAAGVYNVRVQTENGVATQRLTITK